MAKFRFFQGAGSKPAALKIDETPDEFIVRGVSVMTEGPATSHFVEIDGKEYQVFVDGGTLEGVHAAAGKFATGVKVKAGHTGPDANPGHVVIGYLDAFQMSEENGAKKLAADFHVFKTAPNVTHTIKIISTIPDTIGFSAAFDGPFQRIADRMCARVKDLFSIDFVTDPAANPSGVFSVQVDKGEKPVPANDPTMTPEELANACAAAIKPHMDAIHERLSKLEAVQPRGVPTAQTASPSAPADEEAMYSKFAARIAKDPTILSIVDGKLQDTAKTLHALGLVPGAGPKASTTDGNPNPPKKEEDMTFNEILDYRFSLSSNQSKRDYEIVREVTLAFPKKHRAAMEARELGKLPVRKVPFKAA